MIDQSESRSVTTNGGTVLAVSDLTANGSLKDRTVVTTSNGGLLKTAQVDLNGDGVFDQVQTDTIVVASDGSRTETVSNFNSNGSSRGGYVTSTSADGHTTSTQTDLDGDGATDLTRTALLVVNSDRSTVSNLSERNGDGSLRDMTVTSLSGSGLWKVVQKDIDGDGAFDLTTTSETVQNADGSGGVTLSDYNGNGAFLDGRRQPGARMAEPERPRSIPMPMTSSIKSDRQP